MQIDTAEHGILTSAADTRAGNYFVSNYPPYSFWTPDHVGDAYAALERGGTAPAVLNGANEVAVEAFLAGRLAFTGIARVIAEALDAVPAVEANDLAAVIAADEAARRAALTRLPARAAA